MNAAIQAGSPADHKLNIQRHYSARAAAKRNLHLLDTADDETFDWLMSSLDNELEVAS